LRLKAELEGGLVTQQLIGPTLQENLVIEPYLTNDKYKKDLFIAYEEDNIDNFKKYKEFQGTEKDTLIDSILWNVRVSAFRVRGYKIEKIKGTIHSQHLLVTNTTRNIKPYLIIKKNQHK